MDSLSATDSSISWARCCAAAVFVPWCDLLHTWYAEMMRIGRGVAVDMFSDVHLPIRSRVCDFTLEVIELHAMIAVPPGL